jgi:hypothetical protein
MVIGQHNRGLQMHSHPWLDTRLGIAIFLVAAAGSGIVRSVGADEPSAAVSSSMEAGSSAMLSGAQEVPPVATTASAVSSVAIAADRMVTGTVMTSSIDGMAAHIHEGAVGTSGPVLITLTKTSSSQWSVPAGSRLTPAQYDSYRAGGLYVNVHSAGHPDGEIRLQLQ